MKKSIFKGIGTALITPFNNGKVDYNALEILVERQLKANVSALVVLGTTGEPCTLTQKERREIIKFVIEKNNKKAKIIVGCGANSTKTAINNYKIAEKLGADGALIVTPYYNKCTSEGLVRHYEAIAKSGKLPIIAYNVPGRTGVNIAPEYMNKLSYIDNIYGIKEASGNIAQIISLFAGENNGIDIYSGEDALNSIFYGVGASGAISVVSNIIPEICVKIWDLYEKKCTKEANLLHFKTLPLIKALFLEVNPIPVKAGLAYIGLCKNELRMPLTKMSNGNFQVLKNEIIKIWNEYDNI